MICWRQDATGTPRRIAFLSGTIVLAEYVSRHVVRSRNMKMDEEREDLTTQDMAEQAEVTIRTVQRWIKSGKLQTEVLPHGKYRVNLFDLVELSLPLTERATAISKKRRLSYDELHNTTIHLTIELEALDMRLEETEGKIEQFLKRRSPAASTKKASTSAKKRSRSTTLPSDLVTWRSFARLHDIPEQAVANAIKEQKLRSELGYWKLKSVGLRGKVVTNIR